MTDESVRFTIDIEDQIRDAMLAVGLAVQPIRQPGKLGFRREDGNFDLVASGAGRVYVTINGGRIIATNRGAPLIPNMPVIVQFYEGRDPVVVGIDEHAIINSEGQSFFTNVGPHSHRFGLGLVDYVEDNRYEPGLVRYDPETSPAANVIRVSPFNHYLGSYPGGTLDLETPTNYLPVTTDYSRWVLITLRPQTNTLRVYAGAEQGFDTTLIQTDTIDDIVIADASEIPLGAVALQEGQTAITGTSKIVARRHMVAPVSQFGNDPHIFMNHW